MFFKKITHINALRYYMYIIGIKKKIKNIHGVNKYIYFIGSNSCNFLIIQNKLSKLLIKTINPVNKNISCVNYAVDDDLQIIQSGLALFSSNDSRLLTLVLNQIRLSTFHTLFNLLNCKQIYSSGYGTYVIYIYFNITENKIVFGLPSKKRLITSLWVIGNTGVNKFIDCKKFIPRYMTNSCRKKIISVRGVAMNPVDHHNGGRSKKKPLFLNRYNAIAKHNK